MTPTIVLVQGAWGSSAGWSPVAERLRQGGAVVHVPALTGLGARRHHFSGQINLSTHVEDVRAVIEAEGPGAYVLVCHSYGGMVGTMVAARRPAGIAGLLYLDAFVPQDGQSLLDLIGPEAALAVLADAGCHGGIGVPPPERPSSGVPQALRHYLAQRSAQPLATMVEKASLSGLERAMPRRHYVAALRDQSPVFQRTHEAIARDPDWTHEALDCGHMLHLERPDEVAAIIRTFAATCLQPGA